MQITLRQAQIDDALDQYVRTQITVKDGFEVRTTLKATRGDDGATAFVEIVPEGTPRAVVAERAKPGRKPRLGVADAVAQARAEVGSPKVAASEVKVVNQGGPVTETVVEHERVQQRDPVETVQAEPVADAAAVGDVEQPVPASTPKSSLFANVRKPS